MTTPNVFICYRRQDAPGHAGRLYDSIGHRLGAGTAFLDVHDIQTGAAYASVIRKRLRLSTTLIVVIGPSWLKCRPKRGVDYVAIEITEAERARVPIVPALVWGAAMPDKRLLPDGLQAAASFQAHQLRDDDWHAGVDRLTEFLKAPGRGPLHKQQSKANEDYFRKVLGEMGFAAVGRMMSKVGLTPDRSTQDRITNLWLDQGDEPSVMLAAADLPALRNACSSLALPTKGKKSALIDRIVAHRPEPAV